MEVAEEFPTVNFEAGVEPTLGLNVSVEPLIIVTPPK